MFDVIVSFFILVCSLPLLILIGIAVRLKLGSPIIFSQVRPGMRGVPFEMIKFRTMRDVFDGDGNLLPDEKRMTTFGVCLRNSSLDELPELWSVLKGHMSLVGPRPLLMEYLPLYTEEQARRHEVKPGITGWAQVNGRNGLSWEKKFEYDVWYVDNRSFWLDVKILFLTVYKVFKREGISQQGQVTMEPFKGSKT